MNLEDVDAFVGCWRAEPDVRSGVSGHTIVREDDSGRLRGRWVIEAADTADARAAMAGVRQRLDIEISEPRIENGVLLFRMSASPLATEFRLFGSSEAVVGPAMQTLPSVIKSAVSERAIAGHQVRLTRQSQDRRT